MSTKKKKNTGGAVKPAGNNSRVVMRSEKDGEFTNAAKAAREGEKIVSDFVPVDAMKSAAKTLSEKLKTDENLRLAFTRDLRDRFFADFRFDADGASPNQVYAFLQRSAEKYFSDFGAVSEPEKSE